MNLQRPWAGIISCHTNLGWYPAASFVDSRGECGFNRTIIGTDIGNIKNEIKLIKGRKNYNTRSCSNIFMLFLFYNLFI